MEELHGTPTRPVVFGLAIRYARSMASKATDREELAMTRTFVDTVTQLDLLTDAIKWLSKQTGVPFEELSNHMLIIGDVAHVLDKYGTIYPEPDESDYDFQKYDWDDVLEFISSIWHE